MAVLENSKVVNEAGVYRHPETGVELEAPTHPKFGTAMADGFVAAGFVYERPLEAKAVNKSNKAKAVNKSAEGEDK